MLNSLFRSLSLFLFFHYFHSHTNSIHYNLLTGTGVSKAYRNFVWFLVNIPSLAFSICIKIFRIIVFDFYLACAFHRLQCIIVYCYTQKRSKQQPQSSLKMESVHKFYSMQLYIICCWSGSLSRNVSKVIQLLKLLERNTTTLINAKFYF